MRRALLLLFLVPMLMGQDYNVSFNPRAAAGGLSANDFSDDTQCEAFWSMAGADTATSQADKCDSDTTDNTLSGAVGGTPNPGRQTACSFSANETNCYEHDGVDSEYWGASDEAEISGLATFTWGVRAILDTTTEDQFLIAHEDGDANGYALFVTTANNVVCRAGGPFGAGVDETSSNTITDGVAFTAACVWDGTRLRVYVNGLLRCGPTDVETDCADPSTESSNAPFAVHFGAGPSFPTNAIDGKMDDAFIYSAAMTQDEICQWTRFGFEGLDTDRGSGVCS